MRLDEYASHDGVGLAELVRCGEVSCLEIKTLALEAMERAQAALNCFVEIRADVASGLPVDHQTAPFAGVPFALKDMGAHERGVPQEFGSRLCAGYIPETEAFLASAYKASGLVILGRTAVPEFAYNISTETIARGVTRNPWKLDHTPGGSSGGAAAAVASGALPLAHANDGGGSIRVPAAWSGLVGLKPSRGRVSQGPDFGEALLGMGAEHVLTRTVRDCALALDVSAGARSGDPFIIAGPTGSYADLARRSPKRLKVAKITQSWAGGWETDPEVVAVVNAAGRMLEGHGHIVEPATIDFDSDAYLLATTRAWCSQLAFWVGQFALGLGRDPRQLLEQANLVSFEYGLSLSAADLLEATSIINEVCRVVGKLFDTFDVLVTPTCAVPAVKLGVLDPTCFDGSATEWTQKMLAPAPFNATFNMTGQPAISLPLGQSSNGLPIGVQFVGRFADELTLLQVGSFFESEMAWHSRRPPHFIV